MEQEIQEVRLKTGEKKYHFRTNDGRHIFFGNLVTLNVWALGLLAFILVAVIVLSLLQMQVTVDVGNKILEHITSCSGILV
jgi:hypothetical protein